MLHDDLDHFDNHLHSHDDRVDTSIYLDKKIQTAKRKKLDEYLEEKRLREELSDYTVKKNQTYYDDDIFSDYYSYSNEE